MTTRGCTSSIPRTTPTGPPLASYTEDNNQDTNQWEDTTLTLDITQNSVNLRFLAESNRSSEFVEIDNLVIDEAPTDMVPPVITAPADRTFEATAARTPLTATQLGISNVIATDNIDPSPAITYSPTGPFRVGTTTTVTWTATDAAGNTATDRQRVTVRDTTPPTINIPADASFMTAGTSITLTESHYGTANATDRVDRSPTIRNNATNPFQLGTTVIAWTATDDYSNSATAYQTITVVPTDSVPPTVLSITQNDPAAGHAAVGGDTLSFNVTFSEAVVGVDVGDFALSPGSPVPGHVQPVDTERGIPSGETIEEVAEVTLNGTVTNVHVHVNITHWRVGDLKVELVAPDNATSRAARPPRAGCPVTWSGRTRRTLPARRLRATGRCAWPKPGEWPPAPLSGGRLALIPAG